jgi:hypothetical protein
MDLGVFEIGNSDGRTYNESLTDFPIYSSVSISIDATKRDWR